MPEPEPPWIYILHSEPIEGCWRQGQGEAWLLDVFLPFWRSAPAAVRAAYLKRHPPPSDLWLEYLTQIWVSNAERA